MNEMPEQWSRQAADRAAEAQQGLFKAELEESAHDHDEDPLAPARGVFNAFLFAAGLYLVAAVVIAVWVLL